MENQGVWLGPMRRPVKIAMYIFVVCAVLMSAGLIFSTVFLGSGIGMRQMLRPGDSVPIKLTLAAITAALVFSSLYLSDNVGSIEFKPSGFMDWLSLVLSRLAMISIVVVVVVMFYEVVARYIFGSPTLWANEMSLWIAGFIYLLSGVYAMQQRCHIRIYIIYDLFPGWMKRAADCTTVALIWVFAFAIVWGGFNEARDKFLRMETFGTAWDPPLPATIKPAILLCVVLVALQALSNLIADWKKLGEHHLLDDEISELEAEVAVIRRTLEGKK